MMKRLSLAAALALACAASAAVAQTSPPASPPAPGAGAPAAGARAGATASRSYQAIQAVAVPAARAIEAAEKQGGTGRAISVEFERQSGNTAAYYTIKVLYDDGRLVEHSVDATSGQVTGSANQPFERYFTRLTPGDLRAAKVSLRDAIVAAEQRAGAGARAIEAEIDREGGAVVYEIEVVTPDRSQEIKVDANGQVLPNS